MKVAMIILVVASLFLSCQGQAGHSATVHWQAGDTYGPSIRYRIYRGDTCDRVTGLLVTLPTTTTEYVDNNVLSGHSFCYVVSAYDTVSLKETKAAPVLVNIP